MMDNLHNRLDKEHTDALLKDYSADYEIWLEERIADLEATNADLLEALEAIVDLDARSSTREGWNRDIVKAIKIATKAIRKARES
jgi:hypothetical protein